MHIQLVTLAILGSLAAATMPARAKACSCSPEPIYHALPKDGAGGVPLDVAPLLEGPFEQTGITFTDEHGAEQKFKLNVGPRVSCLGGFAELIPEQPLAANTRYTIRVIASYPDSLYPEQRTGTVSFTTGSEEVADKMLRPPQLTTASVLLGASDCIGEGRALTCIGGLERNNPKDHELIARRGDKILLRTTQFIQNDASYALREQPDCIELRRRAPDGRRSEPTTLCGSALLTRELQESDKSSSGWVECKDGILGDASAYEDDADAGVSEPQSPDAATEQDTSTPDTSTPDASAPAPGTSTRADTPKAGARTPDAPRAASGCSVHGAQRGHLQAFTFACAAVLFALRRRLRQSNH